MPQIFSRNLKNRWSRVVKVLKNFSRVLLICTVFTMAASQKYNIEAAARGALQEKAFLEIS